MSRLTFLVVLVAPGARSYPLRETATRSYPLRETATVHSKSSTHASTWIGSFGSGFSYTFGYTAKDAITVAAKSTPVEFALMQMASVDLTNIWPKPDGYSQGDGIIGLSPGCYLSPSCEGGPTDVLSQLAKDGVISERTFTVCLNKNATSGKLHLGHSSKDGAAATNPVPLQPLTATAYHYSLAPLLSGENLTIKLGETVLESIDAETANVAIKDGSVYHDTGGTQMTMPGTIFTMLVGELFKIWDTDPTATAALKSMNVPIDGSERYNSLVNALQNGPSSADVAALVDKVPDLVTDIGEGRIITVRGHTFIAQHTECSGTYEIAWVGCGEDCHEMIWGGITNAGMVKMINTANPAKPIYTEFGEAGDCSDESYGEVSLPLASYPGLLAFSGIMTTEIQMGTPPKTFHVQVDTGSERLILLADECYMYGLQSCQGRENPMCNSCISVDDYGTQKGIGIKPFYSKNNNASLPTPTFGNLTELDLQPKECNDYFKPFVDHVLESGGVVPEPGEAPYTLLGTFKDESKNLVTVQNPFFVMDGIAKTMKPYSKCAESRRTCNKGQVYVHMESSTFKPLPEGSEVHKMPFQEPPEFKPEPPIKCTTCP